MNPEIVFQAVEFACHFHKGQFRKGTHVPYIVHPLNVMQTISRHGGRLELQLAGLFHDLLEDTQAKPEDIEEVFGTEVKDLVLTVTEPDSSESRAKSWKFRKEHTIHFLDSASLDTLCLSLSDKFDNAYSLKQDYRILGENLWKRFHASQSEQKWYYSELAGLFLRRLRSSQNSFFSLAEDFHSLVDDIFKNV